MSKFDRKNQAKQRRLANQRDQAQATSIFAGKNGAARIVAVVPLCDSVSTLDAVRSINSSLDIVEDEPYRGLTHLVNIDRFKQKLQYITVARDLFAIMDACRIADYVLFIISAGEHVDESGKDIIRCVEGQGISQVYAAIQGLEKLGNAKKDRWVRPYCGSFMKQFFPDIENVFSLDAGQEMQNMVRSLCTTVPKGIRWREDRSWMLVENVEWPDDVDISLDPKEQTGRVVLTGVVRGKNLKADRLVHIGDWGDFQIETIVAAPSERNNESKNARTDQAMDVSGEPLDVPTEDQDNLDELAPEEAVMDDIEAITTSIAPSDRKSVLLDDLPNISDHEDKDEIELPKRLPKGTSKYQSAWFVGDVSDSGSDLEDLDLDVDMTEDAITPADGIEGAFKRLAADPTEAAMSEFPESETFDDLSPEDKAEAADLASFRAKKKKDAEEDRQFPDEVELHPNVLARERLARYRGLKSLRTSPWSLEEDLLHQPADYSRLLEIRDYKGAKSKVLREMLVGGVNAGTRVQIYLRDVPLILNQTQDPSKPLTLFSLLRHEHKRTAVDVSISLHSSYPEPLKSKDELVMQCGARRFVINPLFSQGGETPNNVHKFLRYLHPGQTAIASFTGPLTWGHVPILFFRRGVKLQSPSKGNSAKDSSAEMDVDTKEVHPSSTNSTELQLIAKGTMLPSSFSSGPTGSRGAGPAPRIIAKRITLTGQPYKIHKKLVTVRYMFFNPEDLHYFRSLPLWTTRGRQGVIKESLGTHGYFKATFDGKIGMMDAVGVSLYKRVWPRPARAFTETDKDMIDEQ